MRRLFRLLLTLGLILSLGFSGWAAYDIAQNPALRPLIERSRSEIIAATDRALAREASPARLAELIEARLAETPRNWVALEALANLAQERAIPLPEAYATAWKEDSSLTALSGDCISCIWDIGSCSLSTALICKAPILLTPVEDLRGLAKAGFDYSTGAEVDQLDLGLSIVGLGATGLLLASGGTSAFVKAGSASVKLARGMGRLSAPLTARLTGALSDGIRWADLPMVRSADDLAPLLRVDVLRPAADTLSDLGRMAKATDGTTALHLLPLVDDATDARRLANSAEALGPRTIGAAEVLGKSRLLRATLRFSDEAIGLIAGLVGLLGSLGMMLASLVQGKGLRLLRRLSRG